MPILETIKIAFNTIRGNKLRATLTLIGIVIGVFSIIGIMTLITALQSGLEKGFSQLGSDSYQIQKFPALQGGGPGNRGKFRNRPDISYDQAVMLRDKATVYKFMSIEAYEFARTFKYKNENTNPNYYIAGITPDFLPCNNYTIRDGRFFTNQELSSESSVTIIGKDVVDKLFPVENPLGKEIYLDNKRFKVIGVFESKGAIFGQSNDNFAAIPITKFLTIYGKNDRSMNIAVQAPTKETYQESVDNLTGVLRVIRGLKPGEDNNFEIWSNESLVSQVNDFTKYFKYGSGVISFISILAAGVGIMNIMLVSVTERTKEIGIRKALGAKKASILSQFLVEAIVLCEIGGIIGIILGVSIGNFVGLYLKTDVVIPYDWVIIGLVVCSIIGIIFGVYPAYKAAKLDPIDALRYE
jgi:putative ABC transport system permease protein